jgi:hypothetical protein
VFLSATALAHLADICKKKWRLLRSSLIRYIKVFKDKSTSKGNRYRPYYLLEHMDFLLPFIDDKSIIRKVKPIIKTQPSGSTTTVTLVKKDRDEETILYANAAQNTITYNVVATTSKDSNTQDLKAESQQTQDIQQYYNAGVKIIGEDYITTYQPGEQLIYQASASAEEQQLHQEQCLQEQHEQQQQELNESQSKAQALQGTTIIPIPNMNSVFSSTNPSEVCNSLTRAQNTIFILFIVLYRPAICISSSDSYRTLKISIMTKSAK